MRGLEKEMVEGKVFRARHGKQENLVFELFYARARTNTHIQQIFSI